MSLPKTSTPGSNADFDAFVRAERGHLLRYGVLLCGSQTQAEDMVQEVLARVYPRWHTLDAEVGRKSYLRRSLTNEFLSWRRRWSTRMISYVDASDLFDVAADPWPTGRDAQLWSCLEALPARQRIAVVLRYYEDLPVTEIALVLDTTPSSVSSALTRALDALKPILGGSDV